MCPYDISFVIRILINLPVQASLLGLSYTLHSTVPECKEINVMLSVYDSYCRFGLFIFIFKLSQSYTRNVSYISWRYNASIFNSSPRSVYFQPTTPPFNHPVISSITTALVGPMFAARTLYWSIHWSCSSDKEHLNILYWGWIIADRRNLS